MTHHIYLFPYIRDKLSFDVYPYQYRFLFAANKIQLLSRLYNVLFLRIPSR